MRSFVLVVVAAFAVLAAPGSARAPQLTVTAKGVGDVHLGDTYRSLFRKGLIGAKQGGCELSGGDSGARLKQADGGVTLSQGKPQKVIDIQVLGGAEARGVGRGDHLADIKAAFPHVKVDHSTDEVFRQTMARVPKRDGGPFEFGLRLHSGRVVSIGVPIIPLCD